MVILGPGSDGPSGAVVTQQERRRLWEQGREGKGRGTAWGHPGRKAFSRVGQIPKEVRVVPPFSMDQEVE